MPSILIIILLMCSVAEASEYFIATYNIWFDDPTSADRAPKILDTIHNENPDVVAFQEVERWFVNYLKRDDRFSNYNIAYKKTWNAGISGGLLILTKGKILEQEYINLPSDMGRGVLSIVTNIGGISTCVATSHLESMIDDTSIRIQQLKTIISTTSSCSDLVLLGDFNYGDGETASSQAVSVVLPVGYRACR